MHEAQLHAASSFVTLTYEDCGSGSLVYRDFQLFMKRLRKWNGAKLRFFMAGEYGDKHRRPHFHALLFGVFFPDREFLKTSPGGARLYRSTELERLWPFGFSSVGDVTFESAAYVARYVMKKRTGSSDSVSRHYEAVHADTGEIVDLEPEFCRMSLKPGIGAGWFDRFRGEVFPRDFVVLDGMKLPTPRYYRKRLAQVDADLAESVSFAREVKAQQFAADETPERREVRAEVVKSRLSFKRRVLE